MADANLYGVVQTIIESLGSSTLQQIGSIWGVKDELEKMENTVSTIHAVLEDAEEQQVKNRQVKDWLMKLRDAAFDADDLLSEFSTHVLQQEVMEGHEIVKKVRTFFSSSNQLVFGNEMARKLKAMRERFNDIANDRNKFHLIERPLETRAVSRERETHSFVRDNEVIGREEDKKAIIRLLRQDLDVKENVSFISIVGIGGLGKTTVAQYIYNDEMVKARFELKMWVCVSDFFDVKTIVEKIITSATGENPKSLIMEQLQNELRKILNQKMYLLVLDDVWNENEEKWDKLKTLLLDGKRGSKVVITTRTKLVADIANPTPISQYPLKGLSDDQSWALLKRMAFEEEQETINTNFKAIGMDIVKKCKGVPLAIKIIGRVLYHKKTKVEYWSYIKNIELTNVTKLKEGIMPVLKLSYDHLPPHLKCCFAYCSLFPKDYLIDKLTLIQLWIAQGFIQSPDENLLLVDVADDYFEELLWRSFFQEVEEDEGMTRGFKMHDLIHDLAQYVSGTDCTLVDSNAKNVKEQGHHLSFPFYNDSFFEDNLSTLVKANKIRTFILVDDNWKCYKRTIEKSTLNKLISTFRYLRALDLHGLNIKMLPNTIGTLMHLKYLDLSSNDIEVLPSTIGTLMHLKYLDLSSNDIEVLPSCIIKLVNLQILKLSQCEQLRELPEDIQNLVSLKHLDIDGCWSLTHMPCGFGQLTSLQTLPLFVVSRGPAGSSKHCGGLAELNKLNDLRGKIEIKNLAWVKDATSEFKAANLKEKQHLSELKLTWNPEGDDNVDAGDDEDSMDSLQPHESLKSLKVDGYMGVRVSSWLSFLTNLVELCICDCKKCQYLPPLYQLPSLRVLSIEKMDGLEYMTEGDMNDEISASLASPSIFFPSLERLSISYCPNLKGWWRRRDNGNEATISSSTVNHYHQHIPLPSFPRLSSFYVRDCPEMTWMPLSLEVDGYMGVRVSSWLSFLTNLVELCICNCKKCQYLPPLYQLPSLRVLSIEEMDGLEYMTEGDMNDEISTSLASPSTFFPSLERLSISYCPNLKGWWRRRDKGNEATISSSTVNHCHQHIPLPSFLRLSSFYVRDCPEMTWMPLSLEVDGYMGVRVSSWLSFLTNLVELNIFNCKKCQYLPPLYQLPSLRELSIGGMDGLEYMTKGDMNDEISASLASPSTFFPSLERLSIRYCSNLKGWWRRRDKGNEATISSSTVNHYHQHIPLPSFPRLSCFHLQDCPEMTWMPLSLEVDGYRGVRVSSWLSFLTSLVTLDLRNCKKCQYLPPLYQLPSLRLLRIWGMDGLEYMTEGDMNDEISASLASPSTFFPSLKTLEINLCPNLKGWWRRRDKGNEATISSSTVNHYHQHIPLPSFPRLSDLHVRDCPEMTWMPLFPNLEEKLYLNNSSLRALEETIEMNTNTGGRASSSFPSSSSSSSSSFSPPLSKLKKLSLMTLELESLPEEWFKNLTSLEMLEIARCTYLTSLPAGMSHLTSLQSLYISNCPKLKQRCEKENGEDWDKISHIPNLIIG